MKKKLLFWFVFLTLEGLPFAGDINTYCYFAELFELQIQKQDALFLIVPNGLTVYSWQVLKVYDVLGNEVATLVDEQKPAGIYVVEFRIENLELSSGVYFYRLRAGNYIQTKKMIILR